MAKTFLALVGFTIVCSQILAADFAADRAKNWHQWRGPNADGTALDANPPVEWSEDKNVKWKVEIPGRGSASPIVWNDRIFILTAVPAASKQDGEAKAALPQEKRKKGGFGGGAAPKDAHQFIVLCLNRADGKVIWKKVVAELVPHEGHHETNTFASPSPITDGKRIFASFGSRGIYCLDFDGNVLWKRDLGQMRTRNGFGEGSSPTLHGDTLVVNWDNDGQSFITALNASTGEPKWKVDRDELTTWATPLVVEQNGVAQVITNGSRRVRSYDMATGKVLWECGGQASNPIPSPVLLDSTVYVMTGFRGNAVYAIPLTAMGDITDTDRIAWRNTETGPYIASPVLYKGQLYVTKERNAILSCFDAKTGKVLSGPTRLSGLSTLYASPVAAADRIYYTGREGSTLVLKHGPDPQVIATNKLGEGIDASPAIVGTEMFLRGEKHLYCLQDPKQAAAKQTSNVQQPPMIKDSQAEAAWLRHGFSEAQRDNIRAAFQWGIDQKFIPGGNLLIVHKGETVFREAFGVADIETGRSFTIDAPCRIASVTKPHTSTLIAMLVEQGKLSWDDPIDKYLPSFSKVTVRGKGPASRPPKIRELLSHTAGFAGQRAIEQGQVKINNNGTMAEAADELARQSLMTEPGSTFNYTGLGYLVAGRIAEIVTGKDFDTLMKDQLLRPMGALSATFIPSEEMKSRMPTIYEHKNGGLEKVDITARAEAAGSLIQPGGRLISTLDEVGRLMLLHRNRGMADGRRLISETALQELYKPQKGSGANGYGLGFNILKVDDRGVGTRIRHTGASGTFAQLDFESDLFFVFLTQVPQLQTQPFRDKLLPAIGALVNQPREPAKASGGQANNSQAETVTTRKENVPDVPYPSLRSRSHELTAAERRQLPDIATFLKEPSQQFLIDWKYVRTGSPYLGLRAGRPHTGAHVYFANHAEERTVQKPESYPAIYAVADGIVTRIDEAFRLRPVYFQHLGKEVSNVRYGLGLVFAAQGGEPVTFHYSIEPMIDPSHPDFYKPFLHVTPGQKVRRGEIVAHMYIPDDKNAAQNTHIHFNLLSSRGDFQSPSIFDAETARRFAATWDQSRLREDWPLPPNMGARLDAKENPFTTGPLDAL